MRSVRILGVDPGSRQTGFGCIDLVGGTLKLVHHGTIRASNTWGKSEIPLETRLLTIFQELTQIILEYQPQVLAIERVFFAKNAVSALKLGQARGVAILAGAAQGLAIHEYSATEVKSTVVGYGRADKEQVAKMVRVLTGAKDFASADASDGVAVAICHAYSMSPMRAMSSVAMTKNSLPVSKGRRRKSYSLAESVGMAKVKKLP